MPHKLLLADDSVTIQRVIELTFADEDVHVIAVGDGRQAIDRIQSERPDIVLADVGMPERDGYEVAAFVKGHADFAHVPVLLLTGAFEPVDEKRARAVGCDGVLVKPFEPQIVINRVKDLLAGRRPAGLWSAVPAPQPSRASDFDLRSSAPAEQLEGAGDSLDQYFDRLDAAFGDFDSLPAAATEPRVTTSPPASAPTPPVQMAVPAQMGAAAPSPPPQPDLQATPRAPLETLEPTPTPTLPHGPSLAEAFAALLSAEQRQPIAPASIRPEDIPDETIEAIAQRVIDRMGTQTVQHVVLEVAERMVRDEIARIKRGSS